MSGLLFLIAVVCSYMIGYTKRRGEYLELREDFRTLVHEDAQVISEYRNIIHDLDLHIKALEKELKKS